MRNQDPKAFPNPEDKGAKVDGSGTIAAALSRDLPGSVGGATLWKLFPQGLELFPYPSSASRPEPGGTNSPVPLLLRG
jgi:hypothetical protein